MGLSTARSSRHAVAQPRILLLCSSRQKITNCNPAEIGVDEMGAGAGADDSHSHGCAIAWLMVGQHHPTGYSVVRGTGHQASLGFQNAHYLS